MDLYTIASYYIKFRSLKLNFIEHVIMDILPYMNSIFLYILFIIKLMLNEDIRHVIIDDKKILVNYISNFESNIMYKYLWLWKFTGFNTIIESDRLMLCFTYNQNEYVLYIINSNMYYIYDMSSHTQTEPKPIIFNMISLDI